MEIRLCNECQGKGDIYSPPDNIKPEQFTMNTFKWIQCPACKGTGLNQDFSGKPEVIFTRRGNALMVGNFTDTIRLKPKPNGGGGFDLWIDGKKKTRGNKYLRAATINEAVAALLLPGEYRNVSIGVLA